jgi:hypothetical protein
MLACAKTGKHEIARQVQRFMGKQILFPVNNAFTSFGTDTISSSIARKPYTILSYVDSVGCISCKLKLPQWERYIAEMDSLFGDKVQVLLFLHPHSLREMIGILKGNSFAYPVCIDLQDSLNRLNHFPANLQFQTFLLDSIHRITAIGNPVLNPKIKEIYTQIIGGESLQSLSEKRIPETAVTVGEAVRSLGRFHWKESRQTTFLLKNSGNHPLQLTDAIASCDCTTATFSHKPVAPGDTTSLRVVYRAQAPETIDNTISVYGNIPAPLMLRIVGEAEE